MSSISSIDRTLHILGGLFLLGIGITAIIALSIIFQKSDMYNFNSTQLGVTFLSFGTSALISGIGALLLYLGIKESQSLAKPKSDPKAIASARAETEAFHKQD